MSITNYTELQTRVIELLNRDDLAVSVPVFIDLAEAEMARDLRDHWRLEKRTTQAVTTRYASIPVDWAGALRLSIEVAGISQDLSLMSTYEMATARRASNVAGRPRFYSLTGGEIELYPSPDISYSLETLYRGGLTGLSDASPTSWLLSAAPDAYLYGAAKHSAPWLRDDERVAIWEGLYRVAVSAVSEQGRETRHGGTGLRMKTRSA